MQRVLKRDPRAEVSAHEPSVLIMSLIKYFIFSRPFFGLIEFFSVSANYRFYKIWNESQYINTVRHNFCYMTSFTEQDTEFRFYTIS